MVWKIPVLLTSGTQLTEVPALTKMALIGIYESPGTKNSNLLCAYFIARIDKSIAMFKLLKCLAITIGKLQLQRVQKLIGT